LQKAWLWLFFSFCYGENSTIQKVAGAPEAFRALDKKRRVAGAEKPREVSALWYFASITETFLLLLFFPASR